MFTPVKCPSARRSFLLNISAATTEDIAKKLTGYELGVKKVLNVELY
jgi:hypothetical protein